MGVSFAQLRDLLGNEGKKIKGRRAGTLGLERGRWEVVRCRLYM